MRLGELLGRKVVTESGVLLGRVHDVQGDLTAERLRVTGLVAGRKGLLERYGIGGRAIGPGHAKHRGHVGIPWDRVVRVGPEIVVRDD
jgi:sporulation protein YlmC with PRC-barrel domain